MISPAQAPSWLRCDAAPNARHTPMLDAFFARTFAAGDAVTVRTSHVFSTRTLQPYSLYSLPFCAPHQLRDEPLNLGEVLQGTLVQDAPFELRFGVSQLRALCMVRLDRDATRSWARRIREDSRVHLLLEDLPVATRVKSRRGNRTFLQLGYPLGYVGPASGATGAAAGRHWAAFVHNHLQFEVRYHEPVPGGGARIVGFEATAASRRYAHSRPWPEDFEGTDGTGKDPLNLLPESVGLRLLEGGLALDEAGAGGPSAAVTNKLIFTYNVSWVPSEVPYASRWDVYMHMGGDEAPAVHWFSLTGGLAISLLLAALVAAIMLRTVRRDLQRYNVEEVDDLLHEVRWKYLHTDVLRPPPSPLLLATVVCGGLQLVCVVLVAVVLAVLGLLSPTSRGRLLTAALLLFAAAGLPAGYAAARLYRQMRGRRPYALILAAATLVPGSVFLFFLGIDLMLWARGASSAVPFGTLLSLLALWLGIDGPLVAAGAVIGFRAPRLGDPVFTNSIPRQIPHQPRFAGLLPSALAGGLLPFAAGSIELAVLVSSVWNQRIYYLFGFLLPMILVMLVICAEVGIVLCYFMLCREDHRWWWRSFTNTASTGLYLYAYAAFYARRQLALRGGSALIIYYGYMGIASIGLGLITGAVGFLSSYWFVHTIFSSLKFD